MLAKQATRGTNVIIYRKYVVVFRIGAPVVSANKFMYARVKEVCSPWGQPRFDTFHQLIIVGVLWSQPVFRTEQVVADRNEIRTVKRMVKQLPVEMLQ
jgi:hypothetical protein